MRKPDFERCNDLATDLLIKQNLENRILDIKRLKYDKHIYFDSIQNYAHQVKMPISCFLSEDNNILKDGCTLKLGASTYLILYNDKITYFEHLNWTLAHEIGHIYLGHKTDGPIEEIEAHFFAAQLLMPEYTLYKMKKDYGEIYPKDLEEIFGVSLEAAKKRINTMNKKGVWLCGTRHQQIWLIQKKRIDMYYECNKDRNLYRSTLAYTLEMKEEYDNLYAYSY